ncbi:hypothetical protein [Cerasicoccus maritimus]|uniref:hypothetical protein n=1 Tax=Cerasicoccus maritimus TaxID=490089 RepID=UPI002852A9C4|nr:hypothetical protein [Cerasicoccus maritimus]
MLQEFEGPGCFVKFILNESGIFFFSAQFEHRSMKEDALSYEDNYQGNALAGIVKKHMIEIRNHEAFAMERVQALVLRLREHPELGIVFQTPTYYHGKNL